MIDLVERTKKYGATQRISAEAVRRNTDVTLIPDLKKLLVQRVAGA